MTTLTTTDQVHLAILQDAASVANKMLTSDPELQQLQRNMRERPPKFGKDSQRASLPTGQIFRPDPGASQRGGLALSIDPLVASAIDPILMRRLHQIGARAIHQAILKNKEQFVGLIVGHARKGANYFDRFVAVGEQTRIF